MRRRLISSSLALIGLLILTAGVWAAVWWARYPKVPNLAKTDAKDAIQFIGTDDFNRMTEAHRKRYAIAAVDKLREKSFQDLLGMSMTPGADYARIAANIQRLKDRDEVGGTFMRVFLDKFFELPKDQRETYMTMWVLAEKVASFGGRGKSSGSSDGRAGSTGSPMLRPASDNGRRGNRGGKPGDPPPVPTPDQLEKGMANFLAHQPPRTVAQMSELMNTMRKRREAVGLK